MRSLHSARLVVLTLLWGWVVGPAFAVLLTKVLPLAEPHAWRGIDVEIREERGKVLAKG